MTIVVAAAPPAPAQDAGETAGAAAAPVQDAGEAEDAAPDAGEAGEEDAVVERDWLYDEETGKRYSIETLPKIEGSYRWVDENTIRLRHGIHFEVVDHDEDSFQVRAYHSPMKERVMPQEKTEEEKAAEIAAIVASYETDTATADRLELRSFDRGLPRSGQWRNGFDVADMNGDGHLDIVFGPARKSFRSLPNIFLGDGAGNWRLWEEVRFPSLPYDYGDAAAGDLNGDGHMDLAFGVHLRGLLALVSDGEGGFSSWGDGIEIDHPGKGGDATSFSSRAIELIDWNGDGRLDILALGEGPKGQKTGPRGELQGEIINSSRGLVVYLNQGDGTWVPQRPSSDRALNTHFGDNFAIADINRDGRTDIILASGVLTARSILGIRTEEGLESRGVEELRRRGVVGAVAAAEHGGGSVDLFVGYKSRDKDVVSRTGIDIYSPDEDSSWRRRPLIAVKGQQSIYSLDTGDLDGDGNVDLVALTGDGGLWVFLGDGQGSFVQEATPESPPAEGGCRGYALGLYDLDRDGRDEIVAGFAGEPTGLPGIEGLNHPGCRGQGSLRVWKAETRPVSPPVSAGSG